MPPNDGRNEDWGIQGALGATGATHGCCGCGVAGAPGDGLSGLALPGTGGDGVIPGASGGLGSVKFGVGGHLTALRRTRVGRFGLEQAYGLDELAECPRLSYSLDEACLLIFGRRDLSADEAEAAGNGRALAAAGIDGVYAACAPDGRVIALLRDEGARTRSVVVIRPATMQDGTS